MVDVRKLKDKAAEAAAKGKLDKAADLFREALKGDPRDVATRQKLAEVLRRAGRTDEAVEAYRAVADRFAHDGLLIKAIAISKTILELDPEHEETQAALAGLYGRRAAAESARPPARTVMMAAVRQPPAAAPPAIVPPPPDTDDRVVAIPLAPEPPPEAAPEEALPLELLVEPEVAPAPPPRAAAAPARKAETGFQRIVFAAEAAVQAGVEEDVLEAEEVEEVIEVDVAGDEPLGGGAVGAARTTPTATGSANASPPGRTGWGAASCARRRRQDRCRRRAHRRHVPAGSPRSRCSRPSA